MDTTSPRCRKLAEPIILLPSWWWLNTFMMIDCICVQWMDGERTYLFGAYCFVVTIHWLYEDKRDRNVVLYNSWTRCCDWFRYCVFITICWYVWIQLNVKTCMSYVCVWLLWDVFENCCLCICRWCGQMIVIGSIAFSQLNDVLPQRK